MGLCRWCHTHRRLEIGSRETSMRIAIFGDVHANFPALEAVLSDIAGQRPDATYCLGDLVGYAPFPNEVAERVQRDGTPTIMGNYDNGVGFDRDECGCAYRDPEEQRLGDISLMWTRETVSPELKGFLRSLKPEIRCEADGKRLTDINGPRVLPVLAIPAIAAIVAGSENSDHLLSGNSGHLPVALPGQKIVGDSVSGEGKDDRHAQATRSAGASTGGAHVERDRRTERRVRADGAAHRRGNRHHDDR
jgi:predicted phosphodiesterase